MKGERGRGAIYGKGVSYRLGSYRESQNPKRTLAPNRPRFDDDRGSTAPPKLPEISPKHEDVTIYKTRERIQKDSTRDRESNENTQRGFLRLTTRKRKKGGRNSSLRARGGLQTEALEPSSSGEQNPQLSGGQPGQETERKRRKEEDGKRRGEGGARPSPIGKGL